jgi:hypothetical protein
MGHAWIRVAILDHVLVFSASTEVAGLAGAEKGGRGLASPIPSPGMCYVIRYHDRFISDTVTQELQQLQTTLMRSSDA